MTFAACDAGQDSLRARSSKTTPGTFDCGPKELRQIGRRNVVGTKRVNCQSEEQKRVLLRVPEPEGPKISIARSFERIPGIRDGRKRNLRLIRPQERE
mgnify:CR=1 FL=1